LNAFNILLFLHKLSNAITTGRETEIIACFGGIEPHSASAPLIPTLTLSGRGASRLRANTPYKPDFTMHEDLGLILTPNPYPLIS
jgi:hypothetical protein